MATVLQTFPAVPDHSEVVQWGDKQVRVRFVWLERQAAWFFEVYENAQDASLFGDMLVGSKRISPEFMPHLGLAPEGLSTTILPVVTESTDPYPRSELGESVRLLLVEESELPPPSEPFADLFVTVPSP